MEIWGRRGYGRVLSVCRLARFDVYSRKKPQSSNYMLNKGNSFSFIEDLMDVSNGIVFAHLQDLETETESVERLAYEEELDYIFKLICSSFLYVDSYEDYLPALEYEGKTVFTPTLCYLSLPFKDETKTVEVEQWNDLVRQIADDFNKRKDVALNSRGSVEVLTDLIRDCIEEFDYPDRERLDLQKLVNLVLFVYDYCNLTLKEAKLHYDLDACMNGEVKIRGKSYSVPLRLCASICKYEPYSYEPVEGYSWPFENYELPPVQMTSMVENPHISDSNLSAMFVDLMHKFFLTFGLKKKGNSQWVKAERMLIYELLRYFGFCKSSKPASESKYVTTVMNDHRDYFSDCNLRSWIRDDQAYSYLLCCSVEDFVRKGQSINQPFIPLDFFIVKQVKNTETAESKSSTEKPISIHGLPKDSQTAMIELSGSTVKITHTDYGVLSYGSVLRKKYKDNVVSWDPKLDYVMDLIRSSFEYVTFFFSIPKYIIVRNDLQNPVITQRLVSSLERDLLERVDAIPRGNFDPKTVKCFIQDFKKWLSRDDRARFNEEKFYYLFLFIYDYVFLTYKESAVTPHLEKFIPSELEVCGNRFSSKMLIDDMLSTYLENRFEYKKEGTSIYARVRRPKLGVPEIASVTKHPSCNVKNMTALFYDLFLRFFRSFGLTKRSDVKYVSDFENQLITDLASCSGICETNNSGSVRAMYQMNKDFFEKSELHRSIRENEYGYLMMNKMSDEFFGPEWPIDDRDS